MTSPRSAILRRTLVCFALVLSSTSCRALLNLEDPQDTPSGTEGIDCDHAIPISLALGAKETVLTGSTLGGGTRADAKTTRCAGSPGPERIYKVTAESAGIFTARLTATGTYFDSVLYAATACVGEGDMSPGGTVECADRTSSGGSGPPMGGEIISFPMTAGESRYLVVDGSAAEEAGDYELVLNLTDGDNCDTPIPIVIEPGSQMSLLGDNTSKGDDAICSMTTMGNDLVYAIRGPSTGGLMLEVDPVGFDVSLYVRSICTDSFTEITCQDNGAVGDPEGVGLGESKVSGTQDLFVWVDGAANNAGSPLGGQYRLILTPF